MHGEWPEKTIRACLEKEFPGEWGATPGSTPANALVLRSTNLDDDGHVALNGGAPRLIPGIKLASKRLIDGDILLEASGGGPEKPVGRVALFEDDGNGPYVCSNFFRTLRPTDSCDSRFLAWRLMHLHRQPIIWTYQQQTTGIINLKHGEYLNHGLRLPSLPEQRRIAEILDTIDEAIRRTEQVIAKLQQMKQGLLHDLLTRGIDENGELRDPERHPEQFKDSPLGRIPQEWDGPFRLDRLESDGAIQLGRGNVISAKDIAATPGAYPIYSSSAKANGEFGRYGKYMFEEELITWSVDGGGRPFYRPHHRYSVTNVCGYLRLHALDRWDYQFVHASMARQHESITFDYQMKAHPSVIRELYWFARPSLKEQTRITATQKTLAARVAGEQSALGKLRDLKRGLIDDLLTGRVRVSQLEEVTA